MSPSTVLKAINAALRDEMQSDPRVIVMGEDVGRLGGVFRVTEGLQAEFGDKRCFDTPLAETAIIGASIGFAIHGSRPVPEIQFDGFAHTAFEQVVTHLAKYRNKTRGRVAMPITVRIPYGGGIGAIELHGESPESYWVHTPGLRVVTPSNPHDAYWMLRQAIRSDDPVIFLEPKRRYYLKGEIGPADSAVPIDRASVARDGSDATVIAYGPMVPIALNAASMAAERGWDLEVIDLRSLSPLDDETITASVRKTGRCVITHEAQQSLGLGAELAARVGEAVFDYLEAPVQRATGFDTPYPPAQIESYWLPDAYRILDCVATTLEY
ncbi:alpha-ketoacid dehydrogenase subunit beta [Rhodococcoides fascians]|uniref:alpha-ketoacid dehydrogenase subunit beta n=1 Tax=Rhodococcoides fascians TaxID=1828 RepID=UPI000B9AA9DD|nr:MULTISPECIES: alpha-ketoacid dehydrogenase subunit beta [Rhodococcus]OZD68967.1 alpha-ketoacid dehydrogenase subunit beta [Rhodococcus sp. 06-1059B-a]OZE81351.1 alpha-ketoacid dehydrogenase subunit beta [Rhodococcus fascians]OZF10175.1 alpha-ketoacid dehydrogenase subunit beta [Rhodococcus fascians]OZF13266.1 alpha-ketoacid dehydrogenase subunit beta [Rhodococcus fascians]OZF59363.1 alpha-ketoacid dehydrogenase subunit beta [Rhodococcus fascians]